MSENQQRLVYSIIDFLNQSIADGTVKADDQEGLEVAIQCIGEAFNVDPSDDQQSKKLSVKPASLQSIFDVFLKTSSKAAAKPKAPTPEQKAQADAFKQSGNNFMSAQKYDDAIESYNQAIALDSNNPIYYSNRAAAYSGKGDHLAAVDDAEKGIAADPKFMKSYHRLGHAYFSMGEFENAATAFQQGLDIAPDTEFLKVALRNVKERLQEDHSVPEESASGSEIGGSAGGGGMADLLRGMGGGGGSGMADLLRGMGGGAGGPGAGGMPDLASLMNNPQMMAMAQQMAQNGSLNSIMQNPAVANMMNRVRSGDMPSMDELLNDPAISQMASQFGGGR
ncbi:hypothetical protein C0991_008820 [Blastosporella zonata]|nr:hypothetical protein C0991_008820 [Blastosporella zonata]